MLRTLSAIAALALLSIGSALMVVNHLQAPNRVSQSLIAAYIEALLDERRYHRLIHEDIEGLVDEVIEELTRRQEYRTLNNERIERW